MATSQTRHFQTNKLWAPDPAEIALAHFFTAFLSAASSLEAKKKLISYNAKFELIR